MNILHIDSSANDPAISYSRRLSADVVRRLKEKNPYASVSYRDLAADPLPHVDMTIREAWGSENSEDASLAATRTRSSRLVDELKSADIVVIGSPMYNFTVPSTLKSWIDHVAIAGQTFKYDEQGPKGLLTGKAYLALSSGGVYSQGPFSSADHLSTYLTAIFNFVGISDIKVVRAEGVAYGPAQAEAAMAAARERIATLVV